MAKRLAPNWIMPVVLTLTCLAIIPFALIARARATKFDKPRVHWIPDMDNQAKYKAQSANPIFADGRAMRPAVPGTVARGELRTDTHFYQGVVAGTWATTYPMPVTETVMKRGRERYDIYCAPCHGLDGAGQGVVAVRADRLAQGTWTPPSSYHTEVVRGRPVGHLFNTITNGIRNMPAYGPMLPESDRWAVVAYVRALQRSQNSTLGDVPPDAQGGLQ
ncbi:MAG: cytochrome c [Candidatus Eisenbacteria bacterium]|nr:cytochrome c [Candidatus Eisenbacteria bacterium]MCC7142990.1 cytochrome c [Candidatus Eisenbacteria bacterium]